MIMNEQELYKAISFIDDDLITEADIKPSVRNKQKPVISKSKIRAISSIAAAAVITVGSVAFYNAHKPSDLRNDYSDTHSDYSGDNHENNPSDSANSTTEADISEQQNTTDSNYNTTENKVGSTDSGKNNNSDGTTPSQPSGNDKHNETVSNTEHGSNPPQSTQTPQTATNTDDGIKGGVNAQDSYYQPFTPTKDPFSSGFGEDELHHVDVRTADGFYRQLSLDEFCENGISTDISVSDFGGYIGKIVEVNDSDYHNNSAESQEPSLAGADVYYYAPTGKNKAFIIVKKGNQCSIFISDGINVSNGFKDGLSFFDVNSADGIQSIEYKMSVSDGGIMVITKDEVITDRDKINTFYEVICELNAEDYSLLPEHIGTPQWLVDAWEAYRNNPNPPEREDYDIIIKLNDGTVLQSISYQPYLGNGYIHTMQELTPEQNSTLRQLLN